MTTISADKREVFGAKASKSIKKGEIPAQIYGRGFENIHIYISQKEFEKALQEAGESSLITINVEGEKYSVLVQDMQWDMMGDNIIHVDFYRVRMDEKINADVALRFTGEAPAVKEQGGVLIKSLESVEVEALPGNLPHDIEVSLLGLKDLHSVIHVSDLSVEEGVKVLTDPKTVVASITEVEQESAESEVKEEPKEEIAPALQENEAKDTNQQ